MTEIKGNSILITGGAGFIGSHLVQALAGANRLTVLDRKPGHHPQVQYHPGNYHQLDLPRLLQGIDLVYHNAWASTPASRSSSQFEADQNLLPTKKLIEAANKKGTRHFVFLSSAGAVYGANPTPFTETQTPKPLNQYGRAKLQIEHLLKKYASPRFAVTVFRPTNAIGTSQPLRLGQGVIPAIITAAKTHKPFQLYGNAAKDYLPVEDLIAALTSIHRQSTDLGIYNVGSGTLLSTTQLLDIAEKATNTKIETETHPLAPHDIGELKVSIEKINHELHWQPATNTSSYITQIFQESLK